MRVALGQFGKRLGVVGVLNERRHCLTGRVLAMLLETLLIGVRKRRAGIGLGDAKAPVDA
jgi:hypothetical protein